MSDVNDRIGTVVDGKYEIQRLIGKGGMGAVYAARQLQLNRQVALKLLRPDVTADEAAVARFHREAQAMARIEHPNAVRVYDFGETESGEAFIVMEFVEGVPLRVMLRRARILPVDLVLDIVWQTSLAISAAHAQGIVHRDLKPENLIVRLADDGTLTLKVVDFGVAKLMAGDGAQLTSPSDMIGTPKYMAPEQFTGDDIDGRVDVYALGVITYELLTGRPLFDGTFAEVVGKHLHMEPPSFESLGANLPDGVEVVVRRALAKRPEERQRSATELARQLVRSFGVEVSAGTATIAPASETSRSALLDAFVAGLAAEPVGDAEDYATRYSDRGDEETRLRLATGPNAPTVAMGARSAVAQVGAAPLPEEAARPVPSRSWALPIAAGLGAVLLVFVLGGYLALRAYRSWSAGPETPSAPAPAPASPATTPEPASATAEGEDEEEDEESDTADVAPGIPFYMNGRIVIYDDGTTLRDGDRLEVVNPVGGRTETFALAPNDKRTKWVVKRSTRSEPSQLLPEEVVVANRLVEMRIRHADGRASSTVAISRPDE
jgi:predicted Ser/Thr protein kinase